MAHSRTHPATAGLAGGWPGALLGQALFRHKHRKAAFQWVFWLCVLANVASIAVMLREFSR